MRNDITKEEFCAAFDSYKEMTERECKVRNILGIDFSSKDFISYLMDNYYELLISFLDPSDEELEWISWFVWEINFGVLYKEGDLEIDGKEFPIWNSEDFWKFLLSGSK